MSDQATDKQDKTKWQFRSHKSLPPIPVTAEIIAEASKANSGHCMIADAIKKALPMMTAVTVDLQTIRFSDRVKGVRYIYLLPAFAQKQLLRFDYGVEVEPWDLSLPTRPSQIIKIVATHAGRVNVAKRPVSLGPKKLQKTTPKTVVGGQPPPLAVLAHSSKGGEGQKGLKRQFGRRLGDKTFDPTK